MRPAWIMLICFSIYFAFAKFEGTQFPRNFFPLSEIQMVFSEYLWTICVRVIIIGCAWAFVTGEKAKYLRLIAWIITGWGIDFLLEANQGWFLLGKWVVSYETLIVLGIGAVIVKENLDG